MKQTDVWLESSWLFVLPFLAWSLAVHYFPRNYPVFTTGVEWVLGVASAAGSLGLVLLHNAVHLGLAYIVGRPPGRVAIGVVGHTDCATANGKEKSLIALSGPVASLVIAILAFWAALNAGPLSRPLEALLGYLAGASALIALVHLIPGRPLDGGQALHVFLISAGLNRRLASMLTALLGCLAAACIIGAGLWLSSSFLTTAWLTLIGLFILLEVRLTDTDSESIRQSLRP